mgnify:CR=1 FL=1
MRNLLSRVLIFLGQVWIAISASSLVILFVIVLINGSWPDFLDPVKIRFGIGASFFGIFWFPILSMMLFGPGFAIMSIGDKIKK